MDDVLGTRALTSQLADDLGWLEQHCRQHSAEEAVLAGRLRLAAALVRNCIGPFLDNQSPTPLHIAVVGGAGTGKSTVANLLTGAAAAEANPQAGFTRHPIAYSSGNGELGWSGHLGFLGPLQRLPHATPANLDADVYQVRRVPADPQAFTLLKDFVVWDCPDMTTWAAAAYIPRLLEVAALADVVVYVASDERYNDEVPTQFLKLLLEAGKPVVCCLMKMREADVPALVEHFQREVVGRLPGGVLACLPVPHLTPAQLADPARSVPRWRIPLLNQVAVLGSNPAAARQRTILGAMRYLTESQDSLLAAARRDVEALQGWRGVVQLGQVEFDARYRNEYLTGEKFRRFDDALVRLLELLELPGIGRIISSTLWVVRTPYRLLRELVVKAVSRPDTATQSERVVLEAALMAWLDTLRKEAVKRSDVHPVWRHIHTAFNDGLADMAKERFEQGFRGFQLGLADEVDRTARSIYEDLEKRPALLNTLRGGKLVLDVGAIGASFGLLGLGVPLLVDTGVAVLAASVTHQLVELVGKQYVDNQRELARNRQQSLMAQYVSSPLAEWLAQWPATGGTSLERLSLALRRIPTTVQQLQAAVSRRMQGV